MYTWFHIILAMVNALSTIEVLAEEASRETCGSKLVPNSLIVSAPTKPELSSRHEAPPTKETLQARKGPVRSLAVQHSSPEL